MMRKALQFSWRDTLISLIVLGVAAVICLLLRDVSQTDVHVPLIFVLAVFLISLLTRGYFYFFFSSLVAVIGVNYA
ncbi:MAG: DUF4118 domain-containing protein, partial [Oscillospiraceae bacterium]|nr:DUF4118 domain-containing protein [Oscillospiraceae bacterium]